MAIKGESFSGNILHGIKHRVRKMVAANEKNAGLGRFTIWKLKHLPRNRSNLLMLNGKKIFFNNGPDVLHGIREIFGEKIYKTQFKNAHPYILDCGAHIGLATLYFKSQYPDAEIVAFEPNKTNFSFLQKNIAANNLQNVQLRNEAIWKEDNVLRFAGEGMISRKIDVSNTHEQVTEVKATRLKNLLNRRIDFLKIDIEGAEYEVLKDCADTLHMVDFLFIEFHGYFNKMHELTEIFQIVKDNKFSFYIREADVVYPTPFFRTTTPVYDLQLNIFCFKNPVD